MNGELTRYALEHLWAVPRATLSRLAVSVTSDVLDLEAAKELAARRSDSSRAVVNGSVAVIPVYGGITHRSDIFTLFFGGSPIDGLRQAVRQVMADDSVTSVVLEFDSPGGTVDGVPEFADELLALRASSKRVVAHVNTLAASAAYWLATQLDEVVVAPSAEVGSIGVYTVHEDISRMLDDLGVKMSLISAGEHKVDGNPFEPLSDDVRADIQASVNEVYGMFVSAVARGRGVSSAHVNSTFGQGKVFRAREAVSLGMADRVATLDETVTRLAGYQRSKKRMAAADDWGGDREGIIVLDAPDTSVADEVLTAKVLTERDKDALRLAIIKARNAA